MVVNPKAKKDSLRTGDDPRTITEVGRKSTRYVKGIINPGDQVEIELDLQQRDKYRRLLAYVWLQDGRMLIEEIVRAGYAGLMTIPNTRNGSKEAYREARESKKGLWGP